ncbi:Carboxynorspermidine/carboxyspermidine decarboxylase [bioreactor metagenome]|uniref:Carboxynorspermidine/carboxyspermidine decarboxylase n=1 Tax=bioreactor metagenome TaxID=1076179 RepID=A0A644WQ37_9ZZZZ
MVSEAALKRNLEILGGVQERTGAKILLAQKAFSMFRVYPLIARHLSGASASGLYEARLAHEEMGGENHVFSPAYTVDEMRELVNICDHIVFNSFAQLEAHRPIWQSARVSVGIRVNPECSTQQGHEIYDPCAPYSRLGVTKRNFRSDLLDGVEGLHFHTLCEQGADALIETFHAFEQSFGEFLPRMKWINLGGGHHITKPDYDVAALENLIRSIQEKYGLTVYLEPGEAVALNAGELDTTVLDIVENGMPILILDASAACHMPDVLEMPYRPPLANAGETNEKTYTCRLAARSCLAGDVIGDYSFDTMPNIGERLTFGDMAIYSMVKTNTFNGMPLPAIALEHANGDCELVKTFGYEDFKGRLS